MYKPHLWSSCIFWKHQKAQTYHMPEILSGHKVSTVGPTPWHLQSREKCMREVDSTSILTTPVITALGELAPSDCSQGCWGCCKTNFRIGNLFLAPCHLHAIALLNKALEAEAEHSSEHQSVGLTSVVPNYFSVSQASEASVCQAYFSLLIYLPYYLLQSCFCCST